MFAPRGANSPPARHRREVCAPVSYTHLDVYKRQTDPYFGLAVPTTCEGVPSELMIPANTWEDKARCV